MKKLYVLITLLSVIFCANNANADEIKTTENGEITVLVSPYGHIQMNDGDIEEIDNGVLQGVRPGDYFFISCIIRTQERDQPGILQFLDKDQKPLASLPQMTLEVAANKLAVTPDNIEDVKKIGAVYGKNLWIQFIQLRRDIIEGIVIEKLEETMAPGEELMMRALPQPNTSFFQIGWKSSDETVATVDGGMIRAIAAGSAEITAFIIGAEQFEASCARTVKEADEPVEPVEPVDPTDPTDPTDPGTSVETLAGDAGTVTVYSTQGIRLLENAPAAELESLPSGLYIVNGKKILIR